MVMVPTLPPESVTRKVADPAAPGWAWVTIVCASPCEFVVTNVTDIGATATVLELSGADSIAADDGDSLFAMVDGLEAAGVVSEAKGCVGVLAGEIDGVSAGFVIVGRVFEGVAVSITLTFIAPEVPVFLSGVAFTSITYCVETPQIPLDVELRAKFEIQALPNQRQPL